MAFVFAFPYSLSATFWSKPPTPQAQLVNIAIHIIVIDDHPVNHQAGHFGNEHVNHDDPVIRNREKQKKKTLFRRQE
jgi:hypothetical protein